MLYLESIQRRLSPVCGKEVAYSWGPTHTEQFLFQAEGDKLLERRLSWASGVALKTAEWTATRFLSP